MLWTEASLSMRHTRPSLSTMYFSSRHLVPSRDRDDRDGMRLSHGDLCDTVYPGTVTRVPSAPSPEGAVVPG
eukprot:941893-Rhodomonas_salina.1